MRNSPSSHYGILDAGSTSGILPKLPFCREFRLHVGHYVGSLRRRVELQESGEFERIFIMIADAQALTDNADNPEKVRQNIIEVALDYLSVGLDPNKSTLFIQSQIPELCELAFY